MQLPDCGHSFDLQHLSGKLTLWGTNLPSAAAVPKADFGLALCAIEAMLRVYFTNELQVIIPIPIGYQEAIVTPKSSRSVEAYWSFTADKAGQNLVLPDGRCDVILRHNINQQNLQFPVVTGPATQAYMVTYEAGDCWLGVRLRPNNGVMLWRNRIENAENAVLRGQDAVALVPDLLTREGAEMTLADLATVMATKAPSKEDGRLNRALDALHASGGRITIEKLAVFSGCTPRHLNRIFRSHVGLGTKTYAQLVQFHRTLKLVQQEHLSISDAAFEGGYADQAHLARAFRRFGGFTPSEIPKGLSLPALFT